VAALLAAEMTARTRRDPALIYQDLTRELGESAATVEAPANADQKKKCRSFAAQ